MGPQIGNQDDIQIQSRSLWLTIIKESLLSLLMPWHWQATSALSNMKHEYVTCGFYIIAWISMILSLADDLTVSTQLNWVPGYDASPLLKAGISRITDPQLPHTREYWWQQYSSDDDPLICLTLMSYRVVYELYTQYMTSNKEYYLGTYHSRINIHHLNLWSWGMWINDLLGVMQFKSAFEFKKDIFIIEQMICIFTIWCYWFSMQLLHFLFNLKFYPHQNFQNDVFERTKYKWLFKLKSWAVQITEKKNSKKWCKFIGKLAVTVNNYQKT